MFPGQGSQTPGMGLDFITHSTPANERYVQAVSILGWSVIDLSKPEGVETINQTLYTQPALYTHSCVIAEHLENHGIRPMIVAGHSAGEYAALTCAGAWDFSTGLRVIAERARLMHTLAAPGAMAAVLGMSAADLEAALAEWKQGAVDIANFNSPKQIVISGDVKAVSAVAPFLKERGAKRVLPLPVSGAFHSPLMKEAQDQFRLFMRSIEIHELKIPWISNNTATVVTDPETIREHLIRQFCESVRWTDTVALIVRDCEEAIEVGSGKVLQGLVKAYQDDFPCYATSSYEQTQKVIEEHGKSA